MARPVVIDPYEAFTRVLFPDHGASRMISVAGGKLPLVFVA